LAATARPDFLPLAPPKNIGSAIPRAARKTGLAVLRWRFGPQGLRRRIAPVLTIAIEAAMGAGSGQAKRRYDMATIGTFKKTGSDYVGEIVTLSVQAKAVRIVPEDSTPTENAPSHRVFVGRAEIGAAWSKRSTEGRDYLSLKLDDPSFTQPIYANLFDDTVIEGGEETFSLIWSRPNTRRNGD
jgi:uncharacterized protein (DUF736 family)